MKTAKTKTETPLGAPVTPVPSVIPAQAGIQGSARTPWSLASLDSRLRGNDGKLRGNAGKLRGNDGTRSQFGFTLLEVLIALTILAVGILAVMRLFPMALVQQRRAAERTVIASLARTELSEVRTGGMGSGGVINWLQNNAYHAVAQAAQGYTLYESWRSSVARMGQSDVDLYRVVFTVRMNDGREEEFVTYVTER